MDYSFSPESIKDLADFRKRLKVNKRDMGALLGMNQSSIGDWETGRRPVPYIMVMLALCQKREPALVAEILKEVIKRRSEEYKVILDNLQKEKKKNEK